MVKKPPACDSCKLRRVLCTPVPLPGSCSRCIDKRIVCSTTPVVRKKPVGRTGKRIEESRALFGTSDNLPVANAHAAPWIPSRIPPQASTSAFVEPSPLLDTHAAATSASLFIENHITSSSAGSPSETDANTRLMRIELTSVVTSHLLDLYQHIPQSWLPLFPRGRLFMQFESVGRRLNALPPQAEILAHTIIALTSRLSSHPLLLTPGPPAPPFEAINLSALSLPNKDLRIFGRRRQAACSKLREQAVRIANERGAMVETCEDSMACCFLLEMLEERRASRGGKPYGSAYVSHLRSLLDAQDEEGEPKVMNQSLGWSSLIMREALMAAISGRTAHFTLADDLLLCGEVPTSLDEALSQSVQDVDVRDSVTLFFRPMRPYTFHAARLARECSDKITGTYARRQPLNERYLAQFLTSLDSLHSLLVVLGARIAFVLSPAATTAHALPAPFESERQYIMKACLYTLTLAWSSLTLPVYLDLKRRIEQIKLGPPATLAERRRGMERYEVLLAQVYRTTLMGARMVAKCVHQAPSLAFLTHLQQERLEIWVPILIESKTIEDGGEGITRREKITELGWLLDGLKMIGWSWPDDTDLIDVLELSLQALQLEDVLASSSASPTATLNHNSNASASSNGNGHDLHTLYGINLDLNYSTSTLPASTSRSVHNNLLLSYPTTPPVPHDSASDLHQQMSYFPPSSSLLSPSIFGSTNMGGSGSVITPGGSFDFEALLNGGYPPTLSSGENPSAPQSNQQPLSGMMIDDDEERERYDGDGRTSNRSSLMESGLDWL